jgi:DNA processing protein
MDATGPIVAVVGTRRPTGAGLEAAERISNGLARAGVKIVSGLAVGIDATAHQACLGGGGHTVAVLGCGLDVDYPSRNRALKSRIAEEGTLVSEYPGGTLPAKHYFPLRNRIIAGLSDAVVVIEGAITSGALVTARLALDCNRDVYAVPGSIRNPMAEGTNDLIRSSQAALATCAKDILDDLAPGITWAVEPSTTRSEPKLDENERAVLNVLDDQPLSPAHLARRIGMDPKALAGSLTRLEVRGLAVKGPGGYTRATIRPL